MGWATLGIARGPDPGDNLSSPDRLAAVDQVVLVVGVVVGRAAGVAQPQADAARPRSVLLRRVMWPLATATRGVPAGASTSMP
jgi:hypothetical protein